MTYEQTTEPTAASAPESVAPEGIIGRAEALVKLEAAKAEAIARILVNDVKNAVADFVGAVQRIPLLAHLAPAEHAVHLMGSNLLTKDAATNLVNSVQVPGEPAPVEPPAA